MSERGDILVGVDAGTSVIKAVAFDTGGRQLASAAVANRYAEGEDGSATQSLGQTWNDCTQALRALGERVDGLAGRTLALAVTGQGDGTWLIDAAGEPVADAWLWLDTRAAQTARRLAAGASERRRFETTGTGLNACQQGAQLAHMEAREPALLDRAATAFHCKDWLYFKLTGQRATDPSEACFTFGDFRTRTYDEAVIEALGLRHRRGLLPPIVDGSADTHGLGRTAAAATGLIEGTPVSLGFVDMALTGLGAGVHTGEEGAAASTVGSTGVHMRSVATRDVVLNAEGTGYAIVLPVTDRVAQVQTNMAATLNIDWLLDVAVDLLGSLGLTRTRADLVAQLETWLDESEPGAILYHPYISAGERGPFIEPDARAGFVGLSSGHRFPDLARAVVEGLGMAARDCYAAMGPPPGEVRLTGGASRSKALRGVIAAAVGAPVRVCRREETGAAGAAMMAAVANGVYRDMDACIASWVSPLLGEAEHPDPGLAAAYRDLYPAYAQARSALRPVWNEMARARRRERRADFPAGGIETAGGASRTVHSGA